jgi:hypothetical protein
MKLRWIIFGSLFLLYCLPFFQQQFHFIKPKKLEGKVIELEKDTLTMEAWMDGRFQKKEERIVNEKIGLKEIFIRLYNQFNFSCFHVSESPGVVVGKKDFLYLTSYTDNFSGKNFIGVMKVQSNARSLKLLQDALKKKNIDLIIAFAPGKASFYPEYIPFASSHKSLNNYDVYCRYLKSENVKYIDLRSWFNSLKGKSEYKLYPRYGVHWTYYGAYLAADSLKRYIEYVHNCHLPEIKVSSVSISDSLRLPDYDVGELLNIYTRLKDTMPYPHLQYGDAANLSLPKLLVISDSYSWQWYDQEFMQHMSSDWSFWFYNKTMYPESFKKTKSTSEINYTETLLQKDVILLLASEGTMDLFPYELSEKTESLFLPTEETALTEYYTLKIKSDKDWLNAVIKKAFANNKSIDSAIHDDAQWMAKSQLEKKQ